MLATVPCLGTKPSVLVQEKLRPGKGDGVGVVHMWPEARAQATPLLQ